jgi:sugar lactone lactonase YvrE
MFAFCFAGVTLIGGQAAFSQQQRSFPQPVPEKQVTITPIAGVIAAGAKWKLVWQGPDNADGLIATRDGGLLFAQEQPSTVAMLDPNDRFSIFVRDTHGTGAIGFDPKGRLLGAERTCSDPGGRPDECKETAKLVVVHPKWEILASKYGDKTFWRMGELVVDMKGGAYFNDNSGTYYMSPSGKVSLVAGNDQMRTNGLMLSRDEKTLYVTSGRNLVAFDVHPDGTSHNPKTLATLEADGNGDGICIDSEGRLYVTSGNSGIQVFSAGGKSLGVIPLPRLRRVARSQDRTRRCSTRRERE